MSVKIELGNWYVLNDGQVVGPAVQNTDRTSKDFYPFRFGVRKGVMDGWTAEGKFYFDHHPSGHDVKREATSTEILSALASAESKKIGADLRLNLDMLGLRLQDVLVRPGMKHVATVTGVDFGKTQKTAEHLWAYGGRICGGEDERTPIEKAADEVTDLAETMAEDAKAKGARIKQLEGELAATNASLKMRKDRIVELERELRKAEVIAANVGKAHAEMAQTLSTRNRQYDETRERVRNLEKQLAGLEALRPHWAQGFTSTSVAAQVQTQALNQLWSLLGVNHQTAAVEAVQRLRTAENRVFRYDTGGGYMRSMTAPHVEKELQSLQNRTSELEHALQDVVNDPGSAQLFSKTIMGAWRALAKGRR